MECIRRGTTLDKAGSDLSANAEAVLRSELEMRRLFRDHPDWVDRAGEVGSRMQFSLQELKYHFPCSLEPGETAQQKLVRLTYAGLRERYPEGTPEGVARQIEQGYVFPQAGRQMANAIRARAKRGEYNAIKDGNDLARLLTEHLREVGKDLHVAVFYSPEKLPAERSGSPSSVLPAALLLREFSSSFSLLSMSCLSCRASSALCLAPSFPSRYWAARERSFRSTAVMKFSTVPYGVFLPRGSSAVSAAALVGAAAPLDEGD